MLQNKIFLSYSLCSHTVYSFSTLSLQTCVSNRRAKEVWNYLFSRGQPWWMDPREPDFVTKYVLPARVEFRGRWVTSRTVVFPRIGWIRTLLLLLSLSSSLLLWLWWLLWWLWRGVFETGILKRFQSTDKEQLSLFFFSSHHILGSQKQTL